MALRLRFTNFKKDFNKNGVVTNPKDYEDKAFTEDGIFSEKIFGTYQDKDLKRGWIDFGDYYIIHPLIFPYLKKVLPKLLKYIKIETKLDLDGNKVTLNEDSMGLYQFKENFWDILDEDGITDIPEYQFIMKNKENIFINVFPILPTKIRPSVVVKNTVTGSKVNKTYKLIVNYSNKLKDSNPDIEGFIEINKFMWKLQYYVNNLTREIESEFIRRKKGWIRNNMLGSRLNYSARIIIGPLVDYNLKIDEIAIPYLAYLELYKKLLVNMISKSKGVGLVKANKIWKKATERFDPEIYKYMVELNRKTVGGQYCILNRNPTINISSLLLVKIGKILPTYDDRIMQINNILLPGLAADFDGDVLNLYPLFNRAWVKFYSVFSPKKLVINPNDGTFNKDYSLDKEQKLAFYILNNDI